MAVYVPRNAQQNKFIFTFSFENIKNKKLFCRKDKKLNQSRRSIDEASSRDELRNGFFSILFLIKIFTDIELLKRKSKTEGVLQVLTGHESRP